MYIEINSEKYYISIQDSEDNIRVLEQKDDVTYLAVPARLPQERLLSYLKERPIAITKSNLRRKIEVMDTIKLFDTDFNLCIQPELKSSFINGKAIYTPKRPIMSTTFETLAANLLLLEIKLQIAFWEEILNVFIHRVNLRKLKRNLFTVCPIDNRITFDKRLAHKSRGFISYVCATAIFDCIALEENQRDDLKTRYIKDWKHYQRVLLYEMSV